MSEKKLTSRQARAIAKAVARLDEAIPSDPPGNPAFRALRQAARDAVETLRPLVPAEMVEPADQPAADATDQPAAETA